jgi:hypothetical protein
MTIEQTNFLVNDELLIQLSGKDKVSRSKKRSSSLREEQEDERN